MASEHGGGLIGGFRADSGGLAKLFENGRENRLKVGGSGDAQGSLRVGWREERKTEQGKKDCLQESV
jgi:hypothetical protein